MSNPFLKQPDEWHPPVWFVILIMLVALGALVWDAMKEIMTWRILWSLQ